MPTQTNIGKTNDIMRGQEEEEDEIIDMTKPKMMKRKLQTW
jgi:hypothetical protein